VTARRAILAVNKIPKRQKPSYSIDYTHKKIACTHPKRFKGYPETQKKNNSQMGRIDFSTVNKISKRKKTSCSLQCAHSRTTSTPKNLQRLSKNDKFAEYQKTSQMGRTVSTEQDSKPSQKPTCMKQSSQ